MQTAMSISLRGMKRRKRAPLLASGAGNLIETRNSPCSSTFVPGPVQKSSTGTARQPFGPVMCASASSTICVGIVSPDGEELQRLPPKLARPWIPVPR